uniref:Nucleotide-diphospho-sugar transferase domain-containing protein n=1 Tax=Aureoumbra lagunensis TaxID=44058 RepID=A0A7S3JNY1_9STRA
MIYLAKYYTASLLCEAQIRFFFFEMDIWMPRRFGPSILDVFRAATAVKRPNLGSPAAAWALHTDNPYIINAGMYYIKPDIDPVRPLLLFEAIVSYSRRLPLFDQGLMNCLLKLGASSAPSLRFIKERDSCHEKDHPVDTKDPAVLRFVHASKVAHFNWTLVDALVAASYSYPFLLRDTLAVHVLTSTPLTSSNGKKVVAKELMLWEGGGDADYFRIGGGHQYLALDGPLSTKDGTDDLEILLARLAALVALAETTQRVIVLPSLTYMGRRVPSWESLDTSRIKYGWRETTFFSNPRLQVANTAKVVRIKQIQAGIAVIPLAGYSPHETGRFYSTRLTSRFEQDLSIVVQSDPLALDADVVFVSLHQSLKYTPSDIFCEYKHREPRKATLLGAHFDCGVEIESTAKLIQRGIESQKERKAINAAMLLGYSITKAPTPAPLDEMINPPSNVAPMLTRFGRVRARQHFATQIQASLKHFNILNPPPENCPSCFFGIIPNTLPRKVQVGLPEDGASSRRN